MKCAFPKAVSVPLVAVFAFSALPAHAADLYGSGFGSKDGSVYEAVPSWNGFYLGVNGGYGWSAASSGLNAWAEQDSALAAGTASGKFSARGGFGGAQFGYNFQRERLVFGIETDIEGAGIGGKTSLEAISSDTKVTTDASAKSNLDWFGTVRGRLGYAFGGTLVYATGGFAYGGIKQSLAETVTTDNAALSKTGTAGNNFTATGYVVGGGVETAITPAWSLRAEYQYINLGTSKLAAGSDIPWGENNAKTDSGGASASFDNSFHTVRLGLNYKFNQTYEPLK
jgi:outer membrane immunogenic protein